MASHVDFTKEQWMAIIPFGIACGAVGFGLKMLFDKQNVINLTVSKDKPKVVNMIDMEDIADKASLCRCWKSSKFPYCDGTHTKHNEETGDNVGPVVVKRK